MLNILSAADAAICGEDDLRFEDVLLRAIAERTSDAFSAVTKMLRANWADSFFNKRNALSAALVVFAWEAQAVRELVDFVRKGWNESYAVEIVRVLAYLAAGRVDITDRLPTSEIREAVAASIRLIPDHSVIAWIALQSLLGAERTEEPIRVVHQLLPSLSSSVDQPVIKVLVVALSLRWLRLGPQVLAEYEQLIIASPNDEPAFQRFLDEHPALLDPLAVEVNPQAVVAFTNERPDFVVRRLDESYLVVEIETPGKRLLLRDGQWAAHARHAQLQVENYLENFAQGVQGPDEMQRRRHARGLAVVGLERALSDRQRLQFVRKKVYLQKIDVVGFDWLAVRASNILKNMLDEPQVRKSRFG
ncbi:MAG TPA: Shedu anti-phage system protein SduA domain-containing protein [Candidatus Elarobacter sp.]|jgi:hypothetical protein